MPWKRLPGTAHVTDLLLPSTDAGVLAQVVIVAVVAAEALGGNPAPGRVCRVLVIGLALLTLAAIGVRALH